MQEEPRIIRTDGEMPPEGQPVQAKQGVRLSGNWFVAIMELRKALAELRRQAKFNPNVGLDPIETLHTISQLMALQAIETRKLQAVVDYMVKDLGIELPNPEQIMKAKNKGKADGNGDSLQRPEPASPASPATNGGDDGD